jgi:hypothetical protein
LRKMQQNVSITERPSLEQAALEHEIKKKLGSIA